nr:non-ribosomal peptide synthetase [Streptomyces spiramenti]
MLTAEEGTWAGQQLDPASPAHNTAEYIDIDGPLDPALLRTAVLRVVDETEVLRATYPLSDAGVPRAVPGGPPVPFEHVELSGSPDPLAAARAWMERDVARRVDLAAGPLSGHALLTLGPARHLWYHRVHHIALDGYGLSLVARRVADTYTALAEGRPVPAAPFGPLAAVLDEDAAYRRSERRERDRAFWTERFADRPHVATPADRAALPAPGHLREMFDLPGADTRRLRALASELSIGWPEVLTAVFAAHLHRETGAHEVVLGLPVMNRLGTAALRVPAMVRNVIPLRIPVAPVDTLRQLAARTAAEMRACLPHQRYPYEQLRRDLGLVGGERRLSGPGVNIMPFAYDLKFGAHRGTAHNVSAGPVDDLALNVYDRGDGGGLRVAVDANPRLYDAERLAAQVRAVRVLLTELPAAPDRAVGVVRADGLAVLHGPPHHPSPRSVLERIADRAASDGDAVAVEHDGQRLGYRELLERAHAAAGVLAGRGAAPGATVAVLLPRGVDTVTTLLAVLLTGAAYCPLDPAAPEPRLRAMLAGLDPVATVTADGATGPIGGVRLTPADWRGAGPAAALPVPPPEGAAYLMHTSGTTGRPKAVRVPRRALDSFAAGAVPRYGLEPGDRLLQFAPPHFDTSIEEIVLPLCAGATVVVRTDAMLSSVPALLDACDRQRVTVLDLPTAYWHELVYALSTGHARLPASVRTVVIGGEAALPERVDRWRTAVPDTVRLLNTYGPTEATVVATVADLHRQPPGSVPIGLPLPGTAAAVVDGELYLLGDGLADGYHGDAPETDRARFTRLPQLPGSPRAYRTGDLAEVGADGLLHHRGRADDEIKISGHRVQPAEIETALLADPRVRAAAAVGETLPDGSRRLSAHVVPAPGGGREGLAAELRSLLRTTLPAALVPSAIHLTDRLPRNRNGKIDRAALLAAARVAVPPTGPPGHGGATSGNGGPPSPPAPTDGSAPLARAVADVWQRVLGGTPVPVDADIFDLGVHSLQAIAAANRLSTALDREIRVGWLFEHTTPAGLAAFLHAADESRSDRRDGPEGEHADTRPRGAGLPLELAADIAEGPGVRGAVVPTRPPAAPQRRVLLTGATGFVGAHLLVELLRRGTAEVVCPVRAADDVAAGERLRDVLAGLGLPLPEASGRLTPVAVDLERLDPGPAGAGPPALFATCDVVVHSAADVSVMRGYRALRSPNVVATRSLLRLAATRGVPFHLVSTLSVSPPRAAAPELTEEFLPAHPGLLSGYQQTKWVAEELARQAAAEGLPVAVHRLGRVVGAGATGVVNPRDFLFGVLRTSVPAGKLPRLFAHEVWTPADDVARAISALLDRDAPSGGAVYHHAPTRPFALADLATWTTDYGFPLDLVDIEQWLKAPDLAADDRSRAFRAALAGLGPQPGGPAPSSGDLGLGHVRSDRLHGALAGSAPPYRAVDRELVFRQLDHCVAHGLLPAPPPA